MSEIKKLIYNSKYIAGREVYLTVDTYHNNGRIYLGLKCLDGEHFGDITVNLVSSPVHENANYLDVSNLSAVEDFINNNQLGEFTGVYGYSGYNSYPLYEFDIDRIKEYCNV